MPRLPHVTGSATDATRVASAIDAIVAADAPSQKAATTSYALKTLDCSDVETPEQGPNGGGWTCSLAVAIDGAAPVTIEDKQASARSKELHDALTAAGAKECNDLAHGNFVRLANVTVGVSTPALAFDDASNDHLPPDPNVVATGSAATDVVAAMKGAAIDDCNVTSKAFVVCTAMGGPPTCSYERQNLDTVAGSALVPACMPGETTAGGNVDAGASKTLWSALLGAAKSAGYKPLNGTLDQATVVNASFFSWDGTTLGLTLTVDDAAPPPGGPSPNPGP